MSTHRIEKWELDIFNSLADRRNKLSEEYRQAERDFNTLNKLLFEKYGYDYSTPLLWYIDYRNGVFEKYREDGSCQRN